MKKIHIKKLSHIYAGLIITSLVVIAIFAAYKLLSVDRQKTPLKVSVVIEQSGTPRWKTFLEGVTQAANDENVDLSVVLTSSEFADFEAEKEMIDQEITVRKRDGVILALCDSEKGKEYLKQIYGSTRIALIDSDIGEGRSAKIPAIVPDASKQGKLILAAIKEDYGTSLKGKTFGFLAGNQKTHHNKVILDYLTEKLEKAGGTVKWIREKPYNTLNVMQSEKKTDILIALDDESLSDAAAYVAKRKNRKRSIYGIGCSTENVYYLERKTISGLVVLDGFTMGYESLLAIVRNNYKDVKVQSRLVRPDEVFDINNEKLLFP